MAYYAAYVPAIQMIPYFGIHYIDEASFESRSERSAVSLFTDLHAAELGRQNGYSASGRAVHVPGAVNLAAVPSITVTLMTDLLHPDGFVISNFRTGSNTAIDFLSF